MKKLREIQIAKTTNLAVAADVTTSTEVLKIAKTIGDKICILKTHVDIISDFTSAFTEELRKIADEQKFLIFEDRKFADIGNTVSLQFDSGIYKIAEWADIINAHGIVGPGIVEGLAKVNKRSGLILLAQMTPAGNLFTLEYMQQSVEIARQYPDFVVGFIGSSDQPEVLAKMRELTGPDLIIMTPGIKLANDLPSVALAKDKTSAKEGEDHPESAVADEKSYRVGTDDLKQTYNTPKKAVENGSDVIIVGRGIYQAENPVAEAERYRKAGWEARQTNLG